jgi:hypothetical protein
MTNYLRLTAEDAISRGPSVAIFGDMSLHYYNQMLGKCIVVGDDFANIGKLASVQASGGPYTYQDTGVTIQGSAGVPDLGDALGELEWDGMDADNDEGGVQFGYGGQFRLDNASGNTGACFVEFRIKKSTLTNEYVGFFVGLGEGPVATEHLAENTAAFTSALSCIGFSNLLDDGDKADIVYGATDGTTTTLLANAATLVASEYIKLGFAYRPWADDAKQITFYVDGDEVGTYITRALMDAAAFPEGEGMVPMAIVKVGTGSLSDTAALDWVYAVQYGDNERP